MMDTKSSHQHLTRLRRLTQLGSNVQAVNHGTVQTWPNCGLQKIFCSPVVKLKGCKMLKLAHDQKSLATPGIVEAA
jgi:hypothetical protein